MRFATFTLLNGHEANPNEWRVDRSGPYVTILDGDQRLIAELNGLWAAHSDFEIICYGIGWLHAHTQQ